MTRRPLSRPVVLVVIGALAALVLAADQFTKYLTVTYLPYQRVVPVWGSVLEWFSTTNSGAAFSFGEGVTWLFTIALAVVAVGIVWKSFGVRSRLWMVVLGLLLGGVLGNLSDRLFRPPGFAVGHVVDMIHVPWMMPAVFNVADIFIVTGMIAVALLIVLGVRLDGTRERGADTATATAEPAAAE